MEFQTHIAAGRQARRQEAGKQAGGKQAGRRQANRQTGKQHLHKQTSNQWKIYTRIHACANRIEKFVQEYTAAHGTIFCKEGGWGKQVGR